MTILDLKSSAKENDFFRRVLFTGPKSQLVLMSLLPGEDIGVETHDGDQLLYAVKGAGVALVNGASEPFEKGMMLCVPAGTSHNVINTGDEPMKLYTVYAPPQHAVGAAQKTKAEAETTEEAVR